ncbi:unnamed protein product [Chondrus crispus]|uniref:Uncharacterized protein n=1 Tax=Chondrus crispus TaxID=2769 RepID=R7QH46_CHOCR|nr:unnamed protein product [Chondrus crispus]CDF37847.1 unnamed protein product [Chondrus crispus]|eukprot:XP_005717718.1 unnamed protein product [Chondrus crispus]
MGATGGNLLRGCGRGGLESRWQYLMISAGRWCGAGQFLMCAPAAAAETCPRIVHVLSTCYPRVHGMYVYLRHTLVHVSTRPRVSLGRKLPEPSPRPIRPLVRAPPRAARHPTSFAAPSRARCTNPPACLLLPPTFAPSTLHLRPLHPTPSVPLSLSPISFSYSLTHSFTLTHAHSLSLTHSLSLCLFLAHDHGSRFPRLFARGAGDSTLVAGSGGRGVRFGAVGGARAGVARSCQWAVGAGTAGRAGVCVDAGAGDERGVGAGGAGRTGGGGASGSGEGHVGDRGRGGGGDDAGGGDNRRAGDAGDRARPARRGQRAREAGGRVRAAGEGGGRAHAQEGAQEDGDGGGDRG